MSELGIHFEFYRHLTNEINDESHRNGITFGDIQPEYGEGIDEFADIIHSESDGSSAVVIERGHTRRNNSGKSGLANGLRNV